MQKQHAQGRRGSRRSQSKTFPVVIGGVNINMTREQVVDNGRGWKKCHGQHGVTTVNSLSVKPIGNKVFLKNGPSLDGYDANELAVALPDIIAQITAITGTAPSIQSAAG